MGLNIHLRMEPIEKRKPCKMSCKANYFWVPSRTRTDDIQNHNLTL